MPIIGLAGTVDEFKPVKECKLNESMLYREYYYGNVGSVGGKKIVIFESIPLLPFLERTLMVKYLSIYNEERSENITVNIREESSNRLGVEIYSNAEIQFDTLIYRQISW